NWQATIIPNGFIEKRGVNIVSIADTYMEVKDALENVSDAIGNSGHAGTGGRTLKSNGFDLHFTPGEKRIGGLTNIQQAYNAATDTSLHESAILLARTMENARSIKGVAWVSQSGGLGVLTQAMRILNDKGVDFKESEHFVFFSNPTTNLTKAEQLARNIGIAVDRKSHSKNLLNIEQLFGRGFLGGLAAGIQRYRSDKKYTALKLGVDAYKEVSEHKAIVGMFGVTGSAVAAALGSSVMAASLPAGIALAVALEVGPKVLGVGGATMQAYFPKQYKKLTDHF
ncbi:MAG TPA: hypothetical protein VN030_04525, partial [Cellvibrio sp.]|nr:hypothetical protein [Cellvibrio sp.]